ncbi:Cysteine protease atg4 [Fusarium oxysporum]|nr:Cysteine protease ATG4 [Fusarium oxysporum f. sp. raphani]KAJ4057750.1 Cysteine protease atg4 [Fusarium oxysporum]WKT41115.1 Peptidase C54 [Fusarium oxysporum f. sp. vasinfectum]KAJ4070204.1 Cysteine protease atg4 [Fusarium oxysporum]KAJ4071519.1 Cysteine protease atg4 [Fusarium oxysporum]
MENAMANVDLGRYRRIVQMFWDPEPTNDVAHDHPVWCLGRSYKLSDKKNSKSDEHNPQTPPPAPKSDTEDQDTARSPNIPTNAPETPPESISSSFSSSLAYDDRSNDGGWPSGFITDFESRIWMTYRSEFDPIPRSTNPQATSSLSLSMRLKSQLGDQSPFSSDSGWGCMIRSGQSLLANTIALVRLGRDWRQGQSLEEECRILKDFADDPRAPYSIHSFVRHGASACGKYPGEWFGPSATARCIQALANSHEPSIRVYSTGDGPDVYEDDFMKIANPTGEAFHPTLVLVGTRLGLDKITPVYWEALIAALQMPQSVGIAGGRPSSSHYFIGSQGSFLFYLDPHHTRPALPYHENPMDYTSEEIESCHTARLRRIHVREMDPSMLIGFLIRSEEDWQDWKRSVKHVQGKSIIHVAQRNAVHGGSSEGREGAIDEVETLSDDDTDTIQEA